MLHLGRLRVLSEVLSRGSFSAAAEALSYTQSAVSQGVAPLEAAEADLAAVLGVRGGRLRVASFPSAGATLIPLAVAIFRHQHPDVALTLAEGEPEEIAPRLRAGELDLALLFEFGEPEDRAKKEQRDEPGA